MAEKAAPQIVNTPDTIIHCVMKWVGGIHE